MSGKISNHLLTEMGVLVSFSIGKKVPVEELKKYRKFLKSVGNKKSELQDSVLEAIAEEIRKKMAKEKPVPGFVIDEAASSKLKTEKRLGALSYFAAVLGKMITEKEVRTFDRCYLINVLVNVLELKDEDFEQFHRTFEKLKSGEINSPEEEEIE